MSLDAVIAVTRELQPLLAGQERLGLSQDHQEPGEKVEQEDQHDESLRLSLSHWSVVHGSIVMTH